MSPEGEAIHPEVTDTQGSWFWLPVPPAFVAACSALLLAAVIYVGPALRPSRSTIAAHNAESRFATLTCTRRYCGRHGEATRHTCS